MPLLSCGMQRTDCTSPSQPTAVHAHPLHMAAVARQQGGGTQPHIPWASPVRGWRMLKASPSSRAPGQCRGAAGMLLFCMLRASPEAAATRKLALSSSGTCTHSGHLAATILQKLCCCVMGSDEQSFSTHLAAFAPAYARHSSMPARHMRMDPEGALLVPGSSRSNVHTILYARCSQLGYQ